jgi:hypothetical protein
MQVSSTATQFPIGTTTDYTPATITNTGTLSNFNARTYTGLWANGSTGSTPANAPKALNRTWAITPTNPAAIANIQLTWNTAN